MLPYRNLVWEGRQRVKTTYYAGNTVATQQVMGPIELPSVVGGKWKDTFLGAGVAQGLADLFDNIRRAGALLRVEWGSFVRFGIMSRSRFQPDNVKDIAWEVEFEWRGQEDRVAPIISATGVQNPREGLSAMATTFSNAIDEINAFLEEPISTLVSFPQDILEEIDLALSNTFTLIANINATAKGVTSLRSLPRDILERGVAVGKAGANSMERLTDAVLDINLSALDARDDARDYLDSFDFLFKMLDATDEANDNAAETTSSLSGQLFPEIIATERLSPGTDLRDVALRHYGDPDVWFVIAQANGFRDSIVPPAPSQTADLVPRPVDIPRRPEGDLADLRAQGC